MTLPDTMTVTTATGGTATFITSCGGFSSLSAVPTSGVSPLPSPYSFPYAFFNIEIVGCPVGGTTTLTMIMPGPLPQNTVWVKVNGGAFIILTPDSLAGNTLTLTLTDGGTGDGDGIANGEIIDPGGPGVPRAPPRGGRRYVELSVKAYPVGYHWPDRVPESDLGATVEVNYCLDGSWRTNAFLTPFSITVDKDLHVTMKVMEPYPEGYIWDSNSTWDVQGVGVIRGEASIDVYMYVDRTVVAYLTQRSPTTTIETTQTAAETNQTELTTYSITTNTTDTAKDATTTGTEIAPAIPGFPVESIFMGLCIGMLVVLVTKRKRALHARTAEQRWQ